jgi:hypothetical protein
MSPSKRASKGVLFIEWTPSQATSSNYRADPACVVIAPFARDQGRVGEAKALVEA